MKKILILPIIMLLLTGCYNYRELNELAIISAIAIDHDGENFNVSVQVVNPKKQQDTSGANEPEFIIYEDKQKTIQDAFRHVVTTSPNKMYGSHLEVLVISEDVARNYLDKILDFFAREPEARSEFYVLIAKNSTAKEQLSIVTPLINLSATNIMTAIETNNQQLGLTQIVTFNELLNTFLNPYMQTTLPSIEVIGNNDKGEKQENIEQTDAEAKIKLSTTGIFKNGKLIGFLDELDSIGLNIMLNNVGATMVSYKCSDDNYIVSEINEIKSSMEADVVKNEVTLKVEGHSIINEMNCDLNLRDTKVIDKISKGINKEVKDIIENSIDTIQKEYKTDVFGIQDLFYKTNANYFKKNYSNWDEAFNNLKFKVEVDLKLYEKGNTIGGVNHEKNKH